MRKDYHFIEHFHATTLSLLLSMVISFYATLLFGVRESLVCTIVSTQIFLGVLVYRYMHFGYDLSVRERSSVGAFLLGLLPAWLSQLLFYIHLHFFFVYLYEHMVFESLPIYRLAANTPVLGLTFAFAGLNVLSFTEDIDQMSRVALPTHLSLWMILVFIGFGLVSLAISYACYARGVALRDRERSEILQGITRMSKGTFAKRFRFVPIINIYPIFPFLYRHFFCIEYKIRTAILPMLILFFVGWGFYLVTWLIGAWMNSLFFYYLAVFVGIYIWGILVSTIELYDKKC